jgi:hypothetical protein
MLHVYAIDDVGEWHHRDLSVDGDHSPRPVPADGSARLVCDFCSTPDPVWLLPTDADDGAWCACAGCRALILAGDKLGLAMRCASILTVTSPTYASIEPGVARKAVAEAQVLYWQHATGKGAPIPPEADAGPAGDATTQVQKEA